MLEEALQDGKTNPSETCLALLSFLRHELPLGGPSALNRFVELFPTLLERIFGPPVMLVGGNVNSDESSGSGGSTTSQFHMKVEGRRMKETAEWRAGDLELVKEAWLSRKRQWGNGSHGASDNYAKTAGSSGSGSRTKSRGSYERLEEDPVVQLLSWAGGSQRYESQGNAGQQLIQILEEVDGSNCMARKVLRYPFRALSLEMQCSLYQCVAETMAAANGASPVNVHSPTPTSAPLHHFRFDGDRNPNADTANLIWSRLLVPLFEQLKLRSRVHFIEGQRSNHNRPSPYGNSARGLMADRPSPSAAAHPAARLFLSPSSPKPVLSPSLSPRSIGAAAGERSPSFLQAAQHSSNAFCLQAAMTDPVATQKLAEMRDAHLLLTMWEYYLLTFIKFPIVLGAHRKAAVEQKELTSSGSSLNSATRRNQRYAAAHSSIPIYPPRTTARPRIYYGERVYEHLMTTYLRRYIPHDFYTTTPSAHRPRPSTNQHDTYHHNSEDEHAEMHHHHRNHRAQFMLHFMTQLWLTANQCCPTTDEALKYRQSMRARTHRQPVAVAAAAAAAAIDSANRVQHGGGLELSYDLALSLPLPAPGASSWIVAGDVRRVYAPPCGQVQRCIRILVEHLVCDPMLSFQCCHGRRDTDDDANAAAFGRAAGDDLGNASNIDRLKKGIGAGFSRIKNGRVYQSSLPTQPKDQWPLPSHHTIMQTSLYNYIRTTLRHAPVHTPDTAFYHAMDLWLIWLEPWNVVQRKRGRSSTSNAAKDFLNNASDRVQATMVWGATSDNTSGSSNMDGTSSRSSDRAQRQRINNQFYNYWSAPKRPMSPSKYTFRWESYVAANLHFYTVPLAIFLRRAREFDFSKNDFHSSIKRVQRVLRVYSPELVRSLEDILQNNTDGAAAARAGMSSTVSTPWKLVVEHHEQVLNQYCPPRTHPMEAARWSLETLQHDMHCLLEEICLQHRKTMGDRGWFNRLESWIEGIFNEGAKANERMIETLITRAVGIVKFSNEYYVVPSDMTTWPGMRNRVPSSSESDETMKKNNEGMSPERGQFRFLTDKGRDQILHGKRVCNAMDVPHLGDPMYARVQSYEVSCLVAWTIYLSDFLNSYFGLLASDTRRNDVDNDDKIMKLVKQREECKSVLFRFNLRFLADRRNWIPIVIAWYGMKLFLVFVRRMMMS